MKDFGPLSKKKFGRPVSEPGVTETWIGLLVVAAVIAIAAVMVRSSSEPPTPHASGF